MSTLKQIFVKHALMRVKRISGPILTTPSGNGQRLDDRIDSRAKVIVRPVGSHDDTVTGRKLVFQHLHLDEWAAHCTARHLDSLKIDGRGLALLSAFDLESHLLTFIEAG